MKPIHAWQRVPFKGFFLECERCGREWRPDQREPRGECVPKPQPDKAVTA